MNVRCAPRSLHCCTDRKADDDSSLEPRRDTEQGCLASLLEFDVTRQPNETAVLVKHSWVIRLHATKFVILCYSFTKISC
jgi:hypothetical protein